MYGSTPPGNILAAIDQLSGSRGDHFSHFVKRRWHIDDSSGLGPCYLVLDWSTWVKKKMGTDEVCVFSRGKTAENESVSAQRCTWQGVKHLKIQRCVSICWSLKKFVFEIYIKFACWWWFCCRRAKHFHIVLCVWICNSELRHVRIFVTPCSFYVLKCVMEKHVVFFFGRKMPVGWQNFIENPNCADYVGWSKEQCSFATRDCCLTDWADLTVGPTLTSEKSGRVFWSVATNWTTK